MRCCSQHMYLSHLACFTCRKAFKRAIPWLRPDKTHKTLHQASVAYKCPQCAGILKDMGTDFKAPKQGDLEQWRKVELLQKNGVIFRANCCDGPGPRPRRLREVPGYLSARRRRSEGERLLDKIASKAGQKS